MTALGSLKVLACTIVVAGGAWSIPAARAHQQAVVRPTQELAVLITAHEAVPTLGARPSKADVVEAVRPITGEQTVLPVVGQANVAGVRWLQVMLPGRPNGRTGWIKQGGTVLAATSWHIVVRTALRRVFVYFRARLVRSFSAIVGNASTPTPHGQFFVEENVRMPAGSAGAPFALALSARSDVLQEFDGGPGQIAIHGLENLGGTPGTAVSHGCVRLDGRDIRWLAARIAPGVPVTITS